MHDCSFKLWHVSLVPFLFLNCFWLSEKCYFLYLNWRSLSNLSYTNPCLISVPLVEQQSKAIADCTSLTVGTYCGNQNVDYWNKQKWREEFDKNDVLVMTGQIMCDILHKAKISSRHVGLLIFDECHNAAKNHSYNRILAFFADERQHQPHILGLTASIINEKYKGSVDTASIRSFLLKKMKELESRMKAVLITCEDREATSAYATKPKEIICTYSPGFSVNEFEDVAAFIRIYKEKFTKLRDQYSKCYRRRHIFLATY